MKKTFFFVTLVLVCCAAQSQTVVHSDRLDSAEIREKTLDSIYPAGVTVFDTVMEQFAQAHTDMLKRINGFLAEKGFLWDQPVMMHTRMYFNAHGALDYCIYTTIPGQITDEKQRQFEELLRLFFADYRFPIPSPSGFSQCRPVRFQPSAPNPQK